MKQEFLDYNEKTASEVKKLHGKIVYWMIPALIVMITSIVFFIHGITTGSGVSRTVSVISTNLFWLIYIGWMAAHAKYRYARGKWQGFSDTLDIVIKNNRKDVTPTPDVNAQPTETKV